MVRLDASGRSFQGRVQEIGQATASTFSILPNSNADTGNFTKVAQVVPVKIYPTEKPPVELLPGMSASVKITLSAPPTDPVAVKTVKADQRPLSLSLDLVGTLTAGSTLSVAPQLSGTVTYMGADVGQAVKKGQVLLRLDDSTLRTQLEQAQAALLQAQNTVQQAKANRDLAASTLDRIKALYQVGGASKQDLNNAQTQFTNAQVAYQTASTAALQSAQAQIQNLRLQLAKTVITSPVDGTLASRSANTGEVVAAGQPVMSIVDNGPLKLVATLPASETDLVKVGQAVDLRTDALPGESFAGKISSIGPASIATGQFFPLEVRVFDPQGRLRVGMIATGKLQAQYSPTVPVIPVSAIAQIGNQSYVYRVVEGKALRTPVQLGLLGKDASGNPYQVVTGGLETGAQVVVSPVDALWDGATVRVGG
jgi:membrane fusion protein (multidrug efflux system)